MSILEKRSKAITFIGFCIRAGKLRTGVNALNFTKERLYLVLLDTLAGESTKKDAVSISTKNRCPLMLVEGIKLEDIVGKENCKVAGVTDQKLAEAIKNNTDGNFYLYSGGGSL